MGEVFLCCGEEPYHILLHHFLHARHKHQNNPDHFFFDLHFSPSTMRQGQLPSKRLISYTFGAILYNRTGASPRAPLPSLTTLPPQLPTFWKDLIIKTLLSFNSPEYHNFTMQQVLSSFKEEEKPERKPPKRIKLEQLHAPS